MTGLRPLCVRVALALALGMSATAGAWAQFYSDNDDLLHTSAPPLGKFIEGDTIHFQLIDGEFATQQHRFVGGPELVLDIGGTEKRATIVLNSPLAGEWGCISGEYQEMVAFCFDYTVMSDDVDNNGISIDRHAFRLPSGTALSIIRVGSNRITHTVFNHTYQDAYRENNGAIGSALTLSDAPLLKVDGRIANTAPTYAPDAIADMTLGLGERVEFPIPTPEGGNGDILYELTPSIEGVGMLESWNVLVGRPTSLMPPTAFTLSVRDSDLDESAADTGAVTFTVSVVERSARVDGLTVVPPVGGTAFLAGERIRVGVRFHLPVVVDGSPSLSLVIGETVRVAEYDEERTREFRRSGDPEGREVQWLWFSYTVAGDDLEADGIGIPPGALSADRGVVTNHGNGRDSDLSLAPLGRLVSHRVASREVSGQGRRSRQGVPVAEGARAVPYARLPGNLGDWRLEGPDAEWFGIDPATGDVGFLEPPDRERPADSDSDNIYLATVVASDPDEAAGLRLRRMTLAVAVQDADEPGIAVVTPTDPGMDSTVSVLVSDPDGLRGGVGRVVWQRRVRGGSRWEDLTEDESLLPAGHSSVSEGDRFRAKVAYRDTFGEKSLTTEPTGELALRTGAPRTLTVSLAPDGDASIREGGTARVTVSVSPAPSGVLEVGLSLWHDAPGVHRPHRPSRLSGPDARRAGRGDFDPWSMVGDAGTAFAHRAAGGRLVILPGETAGVAEFRAAQDGLPEPEEVFRVEIGRIVSVPHERAGTGTAGPATVAITVAESDPAQVEIDGPRVVPANGEARYTLDMVRAEGEGIVGVAGASDTTVTLSVLRTYSKPTVSGGITLAGRVTEEGRMQAVIPAGKSSLEFVVPFAVSSDSGTLQGLRVSIAGVGADGPVSAHGLAQLREVWTGIDPAPEGGNRAPRVASPLQDVSMLPGELYPEPEVEGLPTTLHYAREGLLSSGHAIDLQLSTSVDESGRVTVRYSDCPGTRASQCSLFRETGTEVMLVPTTDRSRRVGLAGVFDDPDGDELEYEVVVGDPAVAVAAVADRRKLVEGAASSPGGDLFLVLAPSSPGTTPVTVLARDAEGLAAQAGFDLTVWPPTQLPADLLMLVAEPGNPLTVLLEDVDYSAIYDAVGLTVDAEDTDFAVVSGDPSVARASIGDVTLSGRAAEAAGSGRYTALLVDPLAAGDARLTLLASAGGAGRTAFEAMTILVRVLDVAPEFAWQAQDVAVDVGTPLGTETVDGVPVDAAVSVDLPPLRGSVTERTPSGSQVTVVPDWEQWTVTAAPLPPGVMFDADTNELTGAPTEAGVTRVTLAAFDPSGRRVEQSFTFTALALEDNWAPRALPVGEGDITLAVNAFPVTLLWDLRFSDPDGDPLLFDASSSAPGVLEAEASGRGITLTPHSPGWATVTLTATDPHDASATASLEVRVDPQLIGPRLRLQALGGDSIFSGQGETRLQVGIDWRGSAAGAVVPNPPRVLTVTLTITGSGMEEGRDFIVEGANEGLVVKFEGDGQPAEHLPAAYVVDLVTGYPERQTLTVSGSARGFRFWPARWRLNPPEQFAFNSYFDSELVAGRRGVSVGAFGASPYSGENFISIVTPTATITFENLSFYYLDGGDMEGDLVFWSFLRPARVTEYSLNLLVDDVVLPFADAEQQSFAGGVSSYTWNFPSPSRISDIFTVGATVSVRVGNFSEETSPALSAPRLSVRGTASDGAGKARVNLGWDMTVGGDYAVEGWHILHTDPHGDVTVSERIAPGERRGSVGGLAVGETHRFQLEAVLRNTGESPAPFARERPLSHTVRSTVVTAVPNPRNPERVTVALADEGEVLAGPEGGEVLLPLSVTAQPETDFTLSYSIGADGDAETGDAGEEDVGTARSFTVRPEPGDFDGPGEWGDTFPQGIPVRIPDDLVTEPAERFVVTLTGVESAGNQVRLASSGLSRTVEIAASDTPTVVLEGPGGARVGGDAIHTLSLLPAGITLPAGVAVFVSTADGSAEAGTHYTETSSILVFPAADPSPLTVAVPLLDDGADDDPDRTFELGLFSASGGGGPVPVLAQPTAVTTTISDDPVPSSLTAAFVPAAGRVATEGGAPAEVEVELSAAPGRRVSVRVDASKVGEPDPEGHGTEWEVSPETLVFHPAATLATVTVDALADRLHETSVDLVELTLGFSPSVTAGMVTVATVTLADAETGAGGEPPRLYLLPDTNLVDEDGGGSILVSVASPGAASTADRTVSLSFPPVARGATRGSDYLASADTLVIPRGELVSSSTLTLTPRRDTVDESRTSLTVVEQEVSAAGRSGELSHTVRIGSRRATVYGERVVVAAQEVGPGGAPVASHAISPATLSILEARVLTLVSERAPGLTLTVSNAISIDGPADVEFEEDAGGLIVHDYDSGTGVEQAEGASNRGAFSADIPWNVAGPDGNLFGMSRHGELSFLSRPGFFSPQDADRDNVYEVEVWAVDPWGVGDVNGTLVSRKVDSLSVRVTVVPREEEGAVTLEPAYLVTGMARRVTASFGIPGADGLAWKWERISGGTTATIAGATGETYRLAGADASASLRAVARYSVGGNARVARSEPVEVLPGPSFAHVRRFTEVLGDEIERHQYEWHATCESEDGPCKRIPLQWPFRLGHSARLPAAIGGAPPVTYSVEMLGSPEHTLTIDRSSRILAGRVSDPVSFRYIAEDSSGASATVTLGAVSGARDNVIHIPAPAVLTPPGVYRRGDPMTVVVGFPDEVMWEGSVPAGVEMDGHFDQASFVLSLVTPDSLTFSALTFTATVPDGRSPGNEFRIRGIELGCLKWAHGPPADTCATVVRLSPRDPPNFHYPGHWLNSHLANSAPEWFQDLPRLTVGRDTRVEGLDHFRDPDGDDLAFEIESDPAQVVAGVSGGSFTFSPKMVGTFTITATARDRVSSTPVTIATLEVSDMVYVTRRPGADGVIGDLTLTTGVGREHRELLIDTGNDTGPFVHLFHRPAYEAHFVPSSSDDSVVSLAVVTARNLRTELAVAPVAPGVATVTVHAYNTPLSPTPSTSATFDVTVEANAAPTVAAELPDLTMHAGGAEPTVDALAGFGDPEDGPLSYLAESSDPGVAGVRGGGGTGRFFRVRGLSPGAATVTVTAADEMGNTAAQEFLASVVRRVEARGEHGDLTLHVGVPRELDLAGRFAGAAEYAARSNPLPVPVTVGVMRLSYPGGPTLTARPGRGRLFHHAGQTFTVMSYAGRDITVGAAASVTVRGTAFVGGPVTLSGDVTAINPPAATGTVAVSRTGSMVTLAPSAPGTVGLTVSGKDANGAQSTREVTVTVLADPAPVVMRSVPLLSLAGGVTHTVDLSGRIGDVPGDTLAYAASSGDGTRVSVSVSGSELSVWPAAPLSAGSTTVTVTATDMGGRPTEHEFEVEVATGIAPVAAAPIGDLTLRRGSPPAQVGLSGRFLDPDTFPPATLRHSATSSDDTLVAVGVSGDPPTLAVTPILPGLATVTVTATDAGNRSATQEFEVLVEPSRAPTALGSVPDLTLEFDDPPVTVPFDGLFSDPDGDMLALSASTSDTAVARAAASGTQVTVSPQGSGRARVTVTAEDPEGSRAYHVFGVTVRGPLGLSLSVPGRVNEGGAFSFSVHVRGDRTGSPSPLTADFAVAGSATGGADYTGPSGTSVVVPAGQTVATLPFLALDDGESEFDESVEVTLSNARAGAGVRVTLVPGGERARATIVGDREVVALSVSEDEIREDAGDTVVTVTGEFSGGTAPVAGATFPVWFAGTEAVTVVDYSTMPGPEGLTLTVAPGRSSGTLVVTVTPVDDPLAELGERLTLTGRLAGQEVVPAELTIVDNDSATLSLAVPSAPVGEGAGLGHVTVSLDGSVAVSVEVHLDVAGGAATETDDFSVEDTAVFSAGSGNASHQVRVSVVDDTLLESGEDVHLSVRVESGLADVIDVAPAGLLTLVIADDDDIALSLSGVQSETVAESAGTLTHTVSLSNGGSDAVTVSIVPVDEGATAEDGLDYSFSPSPLTIPAGATEGAFEVTVTDDVDDEDDTEVFFLELANPSGGGGGPGRISLAFPGTLTVRVEDDDDTPVTVSFGSASYTATEGGADATVTVLLSEPPRRELTLALAGTPTGGAEDADHSALPAELEFGGSSTSATFTVEAVDDSVDDDGEGLELSFAMLPDRVFEGEVPVANVRLADNDGRALRVDLSVTDPSAGEGDGATEMEVTAALAGTTVLEEDLPVTLLLAPGGTAGAGDRLAVDATVTIPAGAASGSAAFLFEPVADEVVEEDETAVLSATLPGYEVGAATLTITDDDTATLSLAPSEAVYAESAGVAAFALSLDRQVDSAVTVTVATFDGTAQSPGDYAATTSTLVFEANSPAGFSRQFRVRLADDQDVEQAESFGVSVAGVSSDLSPSIVRGAAVSGNINASDQLRVSLSGPASAGESAGQVPYVVWVAEGDSTAPVSVTLAFGAGSATAGADYRDRLESPLVLPAGERSGTVRVTLIDDADDDDGETLVVEATGVSGGGGAIVLDRFASAVTTTIEDNEDALSARLSAPAGLLAEGSTATLALSLSAEPELAVTARYAVTGSPGVDASDYSDPGSGTLTVAAGTALGFAEIGLADDPLAELAETLTVTFRRVGFAGTTEDAVSFAGPTVAELTVGASDAVAVSLAGPAAADLREGSARAYRVEVAGELPSSALTVTLSVAGSAIPGADYDSLAAPGARNPVTIPAGGTVAQVRVDSVADAVRDPDETVVLWLGAASGVTGPVVLSPGRVTATIVETNSPPTFGAGSGALLRRSVAESAAANDPVGAPLSATDPDEADTLQYLAVGDAGGRFAIGGDGQILVADPSDFDHESGVTVHTVTVGVTDGRDGFGRPDIGVDDEVTVAVMLADADEALPAPGGVSVSAAAAEGHRSLVVSWEEPSAAGVPSATGYEIGWRVAGSAGDHTLIPALPPAPTTATIGGLMPGTRHEVRVRALSEEGPGEWSAPATGETGPGSLVSMARAALEVTEDVGTVTVTALLSDASSADLTVTYSVTGADAADRSDTGGGVLVVPAGGRSGSILVSVTDDDLGEPAEAFTVSLSALSAAGGTSPAELGSATETAVTIAASDALVAALAGPRAFDVAEGGLLPLTVLLSGGENDSGVTVGIGAASPGASDLAPPMPASVTLAAGANSAPVPLRALADGVADAGETVALWVSAVTGGGSATHLADPASVTATIIEPNAAPVFAGPPPEVARSRSVPENAEPGTPVGGAVLATDADGDSLSYSLEGAAPGLPFALSGARLTVVTPPDRESSATHRVTVGVSDGRDARGLPDPSVDARVTVEVVVADVAELPPPPDAPSLSPAEADGHSALAVSWAVPDTSGRLPVSGYDVGWRRSGDGTFTDAGHRGVATTLTLTGLAPGTAHEVRVRALNPDGAGPWSAPGSGRTEDGVGVSMASVSAGGAEGGTATVTVRATPRPDSSLSVGYEVRNISASDPDRLDPMFGVLTISAGARTGRIEFPLVDDIAGEPDEVFAVSLTSASLLGSSPERAALLEPLETSVTILASDALALALSAPATVAAGATATATVSVGGGPWPSPVTVGVAAGGSAPFGEYTVPASVTVAANQETAAAEVAVGPSAAGGGEIELTVSYRSGAPPGVPVLLGESEATLTVSVSNTPAEFDASSVTFIVPEDAGAGDEAGVLAASDPDLADTALLYRLASDAGGRFSVGSGGTLRLAAGASLDFESSSSHTLVAEVRDGRSGIGAPDKSADDRARVVVRVRDVDEPPRAPGRPSVVPGATDGHRRLAVSWAAPDGSGRPPVSGYQVEAKVHLEPDASYRRLARSVGGTSAVIGGLSPGTAYDVRVRALNAEGVGAWSSAGLGATSAGLAVSMAAPSLSVDEGASDTVATVRVALSPAATAPATVTYSVRDAGARAGADYARPPDGSAVAVAAGASSADILVTVRPDDTPEVAEAFVVRLDGVSGAGGRAVLGAGTETTVTIRPNDAVVLGITAPATVPAGATVSATVSATGDPRTSDIAVTVATGGDSVAGTDHAAVTSPQTLPQAGSSVVFDIVALAGAAAGRELELTIGAQDPALEGPRVATITIVRPNAAPGFAGVTTEISVAEDAAPGAALGVTFPADPDAGDTPAYTLSDPARFRVGPDRALSLAAGAALDHEGVPAHTLAVTVGDGKDADGLPDRSADATHTLTVAVTDVAEPPGRPGAPTVSGAGETALAVTWTAPPNTGPPISAYEVQHKRAGRPDTEYVDVPRDAVAGTVAAIGGLGVDTRHDVRVRARNAEGTGPWSEAGSGGTGASFDFDVDESGETNHHDALLTFYSWRFGGFLRANQRLLDLVYGRIQRQSGSPIEPIEVLENAEAAQASPGISVLDVDESGETNHHDALLIFYSWRFGGFLRANQRLLDLVYGRIQRQSGSPIEPIRVLENAENLPR